MRVGFKFYTGNGFTTLWTTVTDKDTGRQTQTWGRISEAKISYADFEITEATVTFVQPSDALLRAVMAIAIAEPGPLDGGLAYLSASIWVQDPRFGYDPHPIFYGLLLNWSYQDGPPARLTVTLHDFMRLKIIQRDVQDYQNLTDGDIANMLAIQLNRAANGEDGKDVLSYVKIDPKAFQQKRASSSIGTVRRWQATLKDLSVLDKLRSYAVRLGFRITPVVKLNSAREEYTEIEITPIEGALELIAGTYRRGEGEVISFSAQEDPPSAVMTKNVMNKRFDAVNEIFMLDNAKDCTRIAPDGTITNKDGTTMPFGAIKGPTILTDKDGKPLTLEQYQDITGPAFLENIRTLGYASQEPLRTYHDRIAFRMGIHAPGTAPMSTQADGTPQQADMMPMEENLADAGSLYWRFTGKLETRFNPFITTTDYLRLEGWGVLDANWGIRSFTHQLNDNPRTTYDLTYGDAIRLSG